jgi:hypothetical protein
MVAVLGGCSVFEREYGADVPDEAPPFQVGVTSRSEVLEVLGPPIRVAATPGGSAFLYEHVVSDEKQFGVSLSAIDLDIFKALVARGVADREVLILTFDGADLLDGQAYDRWTERLGTGGSVQFIFAAVPIIDTSRLSEDPPAEIWPTAMLRSLGETLNDPHGLERGDTGLEQLTTPTAVGQHALELR